MTVKAKLFTDYPNLPKWDSSIFSSASSKEIIRNIYTASTTLYQGNIEDILSIVNTRTLLISQVENFTSEFTNNYTCSTITLPSHINKKTEEELLEQIQLQLLQVDNVIFAIYNYEGVKFIKKLDDLLHNKYVLTISFKGPYLLRSYTLSDAILIQYDNTILAAKGVMKILQGKTSPSLHKPVE